MFCLHSDIVQFKIIHIWWYLEEHSYYHQHSHSLRSAAGNLYLSRLSASVILNIPFLEVQFIVLQVIECRILLFSKVRHHWLSPHECWYDTADFLLTPSSSLISPDLRLFLLAAAEAESAIVISVTHYSVCTGVRWHGAVINAALV